VVVVDDCDDGDIYGYNNGLDIIFAYKDELKSILTN